MDEIMFYYKFYCRRTKQNVSSPPSSNKIYQLILKPINGIQFQEKLKQS